MPDSTAKNSFAKHRRPIRREPAGNPLLAQSQRTKFDRAYTEPIAPTPTSPRPHGQLDNATISKVVSAATHAWPDRSWPLRSRYAEFAELVLTQLAKFEGDTWQERWLNSGLNDSGRPIRTLMDPASDKLTTGLRSLFCLRVIRPSIIAMRANKFSGFATAFREAQGDAGLDTYFAQVKDMSSLTRAHRTQAVVDLCSLLSVHDISFADVTAPGLLHFAYNTRELLRGTGTSQTDGRFLGIAAWQVLLAMGHFPSDTPPTLRTAVYRGQLTIEELVDRYEIVDRDIRQLLIDYLTRRSMEMDWSSTENLARNLTSIFWRQIEKINPAQRDLRLDQATYEQWRASLNFRGNGKPRTDPSAPLMAIRGFYLDLLSWAHDEPERWARWAAPCPIAHNDLSGYQVHRRRVKERMDDRTRVRQPLLPALLDYLETKHPNLTRLLARAAQADLGETFTHEHVTYQRTASERDRNLAKQGATTSIRVIRLDTSDVINLSLQEDIAFWQWAIVETLRHAGIRVEELVELTHLSIRQYQRNNGEVIALLVLAPSKSDRERVIPMSAELFHVIARIVGRHTSGKRTIPMITRYDDQDRTWSEPMPFLLQRKRGAQGQVISVSAVLRLVKSACEELSASNPAFVGLTFTPHDFRRLFATEIVNSGLPIHIGAALLGHLNLQTTRGYVAVFDEDVVRHYMQFIERRRAARPADEYKAVTTDEWAEFEAHFDKRKVELGGCGRPYGTPCQHEHACIRCPQLNINPKMLPRLDELEADITRRRDHAHAQGWIGELEGLDMTLEHLRQKRDQTQRIARAGTTDLGLPSIRGAST